MISVISQTGRRFNSGINDSSQTPPGGKFKIWGFASYKAKAHREAVVITSQDRDDVVLISADEYKRLCQLDQKAVYAHELPEAIINELGTVPIPKETCKFDDEYHHT